MKKKFSFFQILIILVAGSAVLSQLIINGYYELNAPKAGRDLLLETKIKEFYESKAYLDRKDSDQKRIAILERDAAVRLKRNENSVDAGGKLVTNAKISSDSIGAVNRATQFWVQTELTEIKNRYGALDTAGTQWGGIGLIFVFEFLSIMLGFMAARIWFNAAIQNVKFRLLLTLAAAGLSIYAQSTSCQITERGLNLLLNDSAMAESYAWAFIVIVPFYFWLGSLDLETKSLQAPKDVETVTEPMAQVESQEEILSQSRKLVRTTAEVPVSQVLKKVEPTNYVEACQMKKNGILLMSVREIADKFNVKKWQVEAVLRPKLALPPPSAKSTSNGDKTV